MKKTEDINKSKIPPLKIVKSLEKLKGKVLFKEKLELANKLFEKAELPKVSE